MSKDLKPPPNLFHSWKSFAWDEIPDAPAVYTPEHLDLVRNEGYNAIWLHGAALRNMSHSDVFPELNKSDNSRYIDALNEVTGRAEEFGVRVFVYLVEPRGLNQQDPFWKDHPELRGTPHPDTVHAGEMELSMCTSNPEVLDFVENSTQNLFRLVPKLAGLKLIVASEYTHHCLAFATPVWPDLYATQYDNLCPRCRDRDAIELVSDIINRISKGAYAAKPEAEVFAFNWNWNWYEASPHPRLVEALDPRIVIGANINLRGVKEDVDGQARMIREYALSYIGPAQPCLELHDLCRRLERGFFVQLVVGTTHECYVVPCIPVPGRVYEKVVAAKRLDPQGYFGSTFGCIPSINTRTMNRIVAMDGVPENKDAFLRELARDCFAGSNEELVLKAWRFFASAMAFYPFDNGFLYRGPMNYALAYKQTPGPVKGTPMNQSWLDRPRGDDLSPCCEAYGEEVVIERFEQMADIFTAGVSIYRKALASVAADIRDPELSNAGIIPMMFQAVANVLKIHLLKKNWTPGKLTAFKTLLRLDRKLCEKALALVEADKRLGFSPDAQIYTFSEELIREKIAYIDRVLEDGNCT